MANKHLVGSKLHRLMTFRTKQLTTFSRKLFTSIDMQSKLWVLHPRVHAHLWARFSNHILFAMPCWLCLIQWVQCCKLAIPIHLYLLQTFYFFAQTFGECSCFEGIASKGYCPTDTTCQHLPKYLIMVIIGTLISSTSKTGNSLITFRTVDPMDKGFTNGVIGTLLSVFGWFLVELCLLTELMPC